MDDGPRGRRLLLVAALAFGAACEPPEATTPVGLSNAGPSASSGAGIDAGPPPGPSPLPPDFRASLTKLNGARFASRGHLQNRFWVDVYANDGAKSAMATGKPMPAGALLAKDQYERGVAGERAVGVLAMQKRDDGTWRWMIVGADGRLAKDGAIEACATCHAQASGDSVFPIVD